MTELRNRVLCVLNYYHPYVSGLSGLAKIVAEGLVDAGYELTVLCGQHVPELPTREKLNGVRIVRAKPNIKLHKGLLSMEFITLFRKLSREADIVLMHAPMLEAGAFSTLLPRKKPLAIYYHCDMAISARGGLVDKLAIRSVQASVRHAVRRADRVMVSSRDYAARLARSRGRSGKMR